MAPGDELKAVDSCVWARATSMVVALVDPRLLTEEEISQLALTSCEREGEIAGAAAYFLGVVRDARDPGRPPFSELVRQVDGATCAAEASDWESPLGEAACRASVAIESYCFQMEDASAALYGLIALDALVRGVDVRALRQEHPEWQWHEAAESSVALLWMEHHDKLIREGTVPEFPYRCVVAARSSPGRKLDREHYVLRLFLHGLRLSLGEELIPLKKGETPDFELEKGNGERVGVEVAEVPISPEWAEERDAQARIERRVNSLLAKHGAQAWFTFPVPWRELEREIERFVAWLEDQLVGAEGGSQSDSCCTFKPPAVRVSLVLGREPRVWVHADNGTTGSEMDAQAEELALAVRREVAKKIWKDPDDRAQGFRRQPSVRPCHLVLYPSFHSAEVSRRALSKLAAEPPESVASHFDHVWLVAEHFLEGL